MAKYPKGIPYIIGNEAAERYSFYGMKAILYIFLTEYIKNAQNELDVFTTSSADMWFHLFIFGAYIVSILGALTSDIFLGKYKTIIYLSIVYCLGHFILAFNETHMGFLVGCTLIAFGAGGIKPCVSAHVGDQFDKSNSHLIEKMYNWFYVAINAGSIIAYLTAEPILRNKTLISMGINGKLAFGIPGILMLLATFIFWLGRKKFVHIPPVGWQLYKKELFSTSGKTLIKSLLPIYFFVIFFWSCFDQTGSTWVELSKSELVNKNLGLFTIMPSQLGAINPFFILIFAFTLPLWLYPFLRNKFNMGYIAKITAGFFLTGISFGIITFIQYSIDHGHSVHVVWMILAFIILTAGEMFTSVTVLEFSYTQAPASMKSFILSFYLISVALGNLFTSAFSAINETANGETILNQTQFFLFFTLLVSISGALFYFNNKNYKETLVIQNQ